jgi:4-aminobutyrate aminotransferase-like enzyme
MKPILALNAFDMSAAAAVGGALDGPLGDRARAFGSASVLFYERPLALVRGQGCWLYDAAGVAYLDAYNNVPSVGHCHPRVVEAVTRQLGQLNLHNRYLHPDVTAYADMLLALMPAALSNITFTCTGSEANDLALRLAASFTAGTGVIVTESAYHGNTALTTRMSPSAFKQWSGSPDVRVIPAPDTRQTGPAGLGAAFAGQVRDAIADLERHGVRFSALLIDSIFSSDGVFTDPPGFLHAAVEVVHRAGGLLIADEVQPGFARTGAQFWGFQRHGVQPDIITLGKPMGNGYPVGAAVTRPEILDALCAEAGYFNTFAGSAVAAAAGRAVLQVIAEEGLQENARRVGEYLKTALAELAGRHPGIADVRGAGLYLGVELREPADGAPVPKRTSAVINALRERHVLIGAAGRLGTVLKIRPPLCFSVEHADRLIVSLDAVLTAVS